MFQYAAARAQAERLGTTLACTGYRYKWTTHFRLWLQREQRLIAAPEFELHRYFHLLGDSAWCNQFRLQQFRLRYGITSRKYEEPTVPPTHGIRALTRFDPDFFQISPGREISGFFQSESYFSDCRERVLSWFSPRSTYVDQARAAADETGVSPTDRCCLHIRRGDYLSMTNGAAREGWALPLSYYESALALLPPHMTVIIITDDPDWARSHFAHLRPLVYCHRSDPIVDMLLLSQCRVNIIANSSFSWWGAYMNQQPQREILFPRHFLGWAFGTEMPVGISVPGWTPITVR